MLKMDLLIHVYMKEIDEHVNLRLIAGFPNTR